MKRKLDNNEFFAPQTNKRMKTLKNNSKDSHLLAPTLQKYKSMINDNKLEKFDENDMVDGHFDCPEQIDFVDAACIPIV